MSTSSQGSWNKNSELPVLAILPSITSRYLLLKFDHFLIGFGIDRFFLVKIIGNLFIFVFNSPIDISSIKGLTMILKIISLCDSPRNENLN